MAALAACSPPAQIGGDPAPASFVCAQGKHFAVNYGTDSATLTFDSGETALLLAEPAASGARYGWPSDGTNYVFLTKAQSAMVLLKDGSQGGIETPLYTDCTLQ